MSRVVVVSGHEHLGLRVVRALGLAGHQVALLSDQRWPLGRFSRHCRRFRRLRFDNPQSVALAADALAGELVVAADLPAMRVLLAAKSTTPRFPMPTRELLELCDDKAAFTNYAREQGFPIPRTEVVSSSEGLRALVPPVFLKPARGAHSEGTAYIGSSGALERYMAPSFPVLAQEFIPGPEVDMSLLAEGGELRVWTIQTAGNDPHERRFILDEEAFQIGKTFAAATKWDGVVHLDMKRDEEGRLRILEANPRFWVTLLHSEWMGVSFVDAGVRIALGKRAKSFTPVIGLCRAPSLSLRGALGALRPGASRPSRDLHRDPVPQLAFKLQRALRSRARR